MAADRTEYEWVQTYTVRSLMTELILFRSSPKRLTAERSISISVSVHLALGRSVETGDKQRSKYCPGKYLLTTFQWTGRIPESERKSPPWNIVCLYWNIGDASNDSGCSFVGQWCIFNFSVRSSCLFEMLFWHHRRMLLGHLQHLIQENFEKLIGENPREQALLFSPFFWDMLMSQ